MTPKSTCEQPCLILTRYPIWICYKQSRSFHAHIYYRGVRIAATKLLMPKRREIIKGPTREELFDALRLSGERRQVTFTCVGLDRRIFKRVLSVSGIRRSTANPTTDDESWVTSLLDTQETPHTSFEGPYSSKTRRGWLNRLFM